MHHDQLVDEEYLPSNNEKAVQQMTHRIKGLAPWHLVITTTPS